MASVCGSESSEALARKVGIADASVFETHRDDDGFGDLAITSEEMEINIHIPEAIRLGRDIRLRAIGVCEGLLHMPQKSHFDTPEDLENVLGARVVTASQATRSCELGIQQWQEGDHLLISRLAHLSYRDARANTHNQNELGFHSDSPFRNGSLEPVSSTALEYTKSRKGDVRCQTLCGEEEIWLDDIEGRYKHNESSLRIHSTGALLDGHMRNDNTKILWWVLGIAAVIIIMWAFWAYTASPPGDEMTATTTPIGGTQAEVDISALLRDFGDTLQDVSLLEPNATTTIREEYEQYVTPALLARWVANPESAPGRSVSSPWPDSFEVTSVTQSGRDYIVAGDIIMMTSTGEAGRVPFSATVIPADGDWLISEYVQATSSGI